MAGIKIIGLDEWRNRLGGAAVGDVMARALEQAAEHVAEAVRDELGQAPGSGSHDTPWERTGALRESIAVQAEGLEAAVGSNDPAAAPQELGTLHLPPRPFLVPVAARMGESLAQSIGAAVAAALGGEPSED